MSFTKEFNEFFNCYNSNSNKNRLKTLNEKRLQIAQKAEPII